jgi:hypothetical protein
VTTPIPNAELAYRVLDIARTARSLEMEYWANNLSGGLITLADLTAPTCGTTACLAGWTVALAGYAIKARGSVYNAAGDYVGDVQPMAARMLGISDLASEDLFYVSNDDLDAAIADYFGPRPERAE